MDELITDLTPAPLRATVVVVARNRVSQLRRALAAIEGSEQRPQLQPVVVDNGSNDGSEALDAEFPNVQFIRLPKNFGLTKAWNLGWRAADAPYVLFQHDDAELAPGAAARLADVLDADHSVAAACPLLVDGEGRPSPQVGALPPDGTFRPASPSGDSPLTVAYASSAAIMVRVALIRSIRQIDEHFGQYGGDADLAAQFARAGKRTVIVPEALCTHIPSDQRDAALDADLALGRARFVWKHSGIVAGLQARLGTICGPLFGLRLGELRYTLPGQKIDGTQE